MASDSLGWVYQFWQSEQKSAVNNSGSKIGADELPAVTQLFTEDYMVDFLLDNTLGAWHAGKVLNRNKELAETARDETELRAAVSLPGIPWTYLRFVRGEDKIWRPAAGVFDGWPEAAKDLKCLDPCMGSGHFIVAMFERLVALRMAEESVDQRAAVHAAISENLFGLEIDPRCTQIAAFNLAFAAWRRVGHGPLPAMNLACSGLGPNAKKDDWVKLGKGADKLQRGMGQLHQLFEKAPLLGSLINPRATKGDLLLAEFHELQPLLEKAMMQEAKDETAREMTVTARGIAKAAEILAGKFVLVATNVPYLGRGKQSEMLRVHCDHAHAAAKADLATCFVERCIDFCLPAGSVSLVTPQNWWFLGSYKTLRDRLLREHAFNFIVTLGEEAWQSFGDRGPVAALNVVSSVGPTAGHIMAGLDALPKPTIAEKTIELREGPVTLLAQKGQHENPDHRIMVDDPISGPLLYRYAESYQGVSPADFPHYGRSFWEISGGTKWRFWQSTVEETSSYGGRSLALWWNDDLREAVRSGQAYIRGDKAWNKRGVACRQMRNLSCTLYTGEAFDTNTAVIVPRDEADLPAVWAFCSSSEFRTTVRRIDKKVNVTNASFVKVPFDAARWQEVATQKYPNGLPRPFSADATQWLFGGHPKSSDQPLQVATARLLGYKWPRQTGSSFADSPAVGPDGLEKFASDDGIVSMPSVRGEEPAAERLRKLLAAAYAPEWNPQAELGLIRATGSKAGDFDEWLRDDFFAQHCDVFHQRPFVWHVWDGLKNGFHALVSYHKLAAPNGEGRQTLEKLIYSYLGDWIDRQRADQRNNVEGSDLRLAAAEHLKKELERILEGEPPCDIFVRWKPLSQQPVGWDPDIDDGVRINIRPFMTTKTLNPRSNDASIFRSTPNVKWDKDRGKEPQRSRENFPWFWGWDETTEDFSGRDEFDGNRWNDLHYSRQFKAQARGKPAKRDDGCNR